MYNVCLIGHGYWGEKLARNFNNFEFFKLNSIVDKKSYNLNSAKKLYPNIKLYKDYRNAIKKSFADLIIVSTPTSTHYKIAKYALESEKHVLVEKPLCLNLSEVKELNKIAKKKKKFIFVDYPFLFSGTISFIKKLIQKKTYGKILEIESYREQAPLRKDANVIWDLCTHDISILNYLLKKNPYKISTIKKKNLKNYPVDLAFINLKYENNLNVVIKNSWISPVKVRNFIIKFKKAILYCDENESLYKIKIYKNKFNQNSVKYDLEVPKIDLEEPLSKLVKYIYSSLKNKKNYLFNNNFNERLTRLLEKINN